MVFDFGTLVGIDNPVFKGGLGLMVIGGAAALLRHAPQKVWQFATRGLWLETFVDGLDPAFFWVNQWLAERPEVQASNKVRVESRWFDDDTGNRNERRTTLIPGVGEHIITFENARFWFSVGKEEKSAAAGVMRSSNDPFRPYSITIRTRKKNRALVLRLLNEADELSRQIDPTRTRVYLPSYEHWELRSVQNIRKAESVVLARGVYERLVRELTEFTVTRARYEELGIPYRRGYLLHGPPGNGKSSLALALAGVLKRDLFVLALGSHDLDDHKLITLLAAVPPNAVVLVEDVDTVFRGRERQAENKLTFSGVLNAIDGALASEGRVLFVTANHPEVLDAALVRPGRCDDHVELLNASFEQAQRLFLRFHPGYTGYAIKFAAWAGTGKHSMAALQGHLLRHPKPSDAVKEL